MDQYERYIDYINKNILPYIDYNRLQESYGTEDKSYAKMTLYTLHEAARQIYGPALFCHGGLDFALVPGVISSRENGNVCLALLGIDLMSSGEHCSTDFLTQYGVVSQGHVEDKGIQTFMKEKYGAYHYGYTLDIAGDIHVRPGDLPQEIREILSTFEAHAAELTDRILQDENEADEDLEL